MYTVFGAGSVGTVLATLLADAGVDVAMAGREAVPRLRAEGDDETILATVPVVEEPVGEILLCVQEPDVAELAGRFPGRRITAFCNGVEAIPGVDHAIWRMTCTLTEPGVAKFTRRGRVIVTREPLANDLRAAGLDVGVSNDIAADRWLKLLANLGSAPNALVRSEDHARAEFGALKAGLIAEAWELLQARGIEARSCDGRDASPEEEIERQRNVGGRARAVHNATWRTLSRGRKQRERFHKTIADLGRAPRNEAMQQLVDLAVGPECYGLDELLSLLPGA